MGIQEEREEAVVRELVAEAGNVPLDPSAFLAGAHEGRRARARIRRRARVLRPLAGLLRQVLEPGEEVACAAVASRYALAEYAWLGWAAHQANRTALVLTARRLLLLEVDGAGRPRDRKSQLWLGGLRRVWLRLGTLRLELSDGRRLQFARLGGADRRRLTALLSAHRGAAGARPLGRPVLEHLCPACLRPVPGAPGSILACPEPTCRAPFRDPAHAARLALLAPGLGRLYLRQPALGAAQFLGGMVLLGAALGLGRAAPGAPGLAVGVALLVVAPRLLDHALTRLLGARGLVPLAAPGLPGGPRNARALPAWTPLLVAVGVALTLAAAAAPWAR